MNIDWYRETEKKIEDSNTTQKLRDTLTGAFEKLGLPFWMIAVQVPSSLHGPEMYGINNYPDFWWEEYIANNLVAFDPLPRYAIANEHPRMWTTEGWHDVKGHSWSDEGQEVVRIFQEVKKLGANSGLLLPFHTGDNTCAGLNLPHPFMIDKSFEIFLNARIWVFALLPQIMTAVNKLYKEIRDEDGVHLTPREKEVLLWVGEGLTSKAIADKLGISFRTIEHYIADIQRKLGVMNRHQAVAKAVNTSLILPIVVPGGITYTLSANREVFHEFNAKTKKRKDSSKGRE